MNMGLPFRDSTAAFTAVFLKRIGFYAAAGYVQERSYYVFSMSVPLSWCLSRDIGISFASKEYGTGFNEICRK